MYVFMFFITLVWQSRKPSLTSIYFNVELISPMYADSMCILETLPFFSCVTGKSHWLRFGDIKIDKGLFHFKPSVNIIPRIIELSKL